MSTSRDEGTTVAPRGALNEARRAEILDAAEVVLAEKGYRDTTVQEVAGKVGLAKGSLYYYIENKEDLLYQVLYRANARYLEALRADPEVQRADPVARLSRFIDRHMQQIELDRSWLDDRQHVFLDATRLAAINALRHKTFLLLKGILVDGVERGVFDASMDPSVATNSLLSMMNNTTRWHRPRGRHSIPEIAAWYKSLVLHGLLCD